MTARSTTDGTGWGGRRPGAGRKRPTADPLYPREVRLTMAQIAFVNRHGGGHFATGLRRLIDEARAQEPSPDTARLADSRAPRP